MLARRGVFYGWVVVAAAFLVMLATAAAQGMPGVLLRPITSEFGWSTADVSGAQSLRLLLYGLMGPFAAALIALYGMRAVVAAAAVCIVGGILLATRITAAWQLWLCWGVLVGIGTGMTALVLGATVANRWFTRRRGLVVGLLTASSATGSLIFLPAAAWLAQHEGWRVALLPAAAACALAGVLMWLFGRDHPGELGLAPSGELAVVPPPDRRASGGAARLAVRTLAEAARTRAFWLLFFTFFVCGLSTTGLIGTHFIPLCQDFGMPEVTAASVLAMMGAFDFVGTIGSGFLTDRVDSRWLLFFYYGLRGLSLLWRRPLNPRHPGGGAGRAIASRSRRGWPGDRRNRRVPCRCASRRRPRPPPRRPRQTRTRRRALRATMSPAGGSARRCRERRRGRRRWPA
jgi:sugar phosphate permease